MEVLKILKNFFGEVENLQMVKGGHLKAVYSFSHQGSEYVIRLSKEDKEFIVENILYKMLENHNIPISKIIKIGVEGDFYYTISNRVYGVTMKELDEKQIHHVLPNLIEVITRIHLTDVNKTKGYGWFNKDGNGQFNSFREQIENHFHKEQIGFWKNWYQLFEGDLLQYKDFQFLYEKMIDLSIYCEGHRAIVHGDFHLGNLMSNGKEITGLIDWGNLMYGDFLLDVATLHMQIPQLNIVKQFEKYYQAQSIIVPNFTERIICTSLFKGLDSLRFSAKLGNRQSCNYILHYLKDLLKDGIKSL